MAQQNEQDRQACLSGPDPWEGRRMKIQSNHSVPHMQRWPWQALRLAQDNPRVGEHVRSAKALSGVCPQQSPDQ